MALATLAVAVVSMQGAEDSTGRGTAVPEGTQESVAAADGGIVTCEVSLRDEVQATCDAGDLARYGDLTSGWNGRVSRWTLTNGATVSAIWEDWSPQDVLVESGAEEWLHSGNSAGQRTNDRFQHLTIRGPVGAEVRIFDHVDRNEPSLLMVIVKDD